MDPNGVPMKAAPSMPMPGSSSKQPEGHAGGPGDGVTMKAAPMKAAPMKAAGGPGVPDGPGVPAGGPGVPDGPGVPAGGPAEFHDLKNSLTATAKVAGVPPLFQTPLPPSVWVVEGAGVVKLGEAVQDLAIKHMEFAEWQLNNLLTAEREINFLRDRVAAVEAGLQQAAGTAQQAAATARQAAVMAQQATATAAAQAATIASLETRMAALMGVAGGGGQPSRARSAGHGSNDDDEPVILFRRAGN